MRLTLAANTRTRLLDLLQNPDAPNAALKNPAAAGNIENGAHYYGVSFVGPYGESAVLAVSEVVTVVDKTTNGKISLTNIPIGPTGTTARNVYRTAAGGSTLKLQSQIANNTATTLLDNTADASLTTTAPAVDTSGLRHALGMYEDLVISVPDDSANTVSIFGDTNNPNISDTNYGFKLDAGGNNFQRFERSAHQPVAAAHIWLYASAISRFNITGREI